jgi:hypothetical protein
MRLRKKRELMEKEACWLKDSRSPYIRGCAAIEIMLICWLQRCVAFQGQGKGTLRRTRLVIDSVLCTTILSLHG